jgi:predicted TIM-barrel fold metal-dependent hydrolase
MGELRPEEQGYLSENWGALNGIAEWAGPRGLPAVVHSSEPVGHLYPGKGKMTPDMLQGLVQAYPDWPLVLAHMGGGLPFYAAMPEVRRALANVWVDTAAWPLLYDPSIFAALATVFGTERILFGSDFPLLRQERVLKATHALPVSEPALRGILGENARRLLHL